MCICAHLLSLGFTGSCASYGLDQEGAAPLSSHQSETKFPEERRRKAAGVAERGVAGLKLMGSYGSFTKPYVHVDNLLGFLEDRLQGRQGLCQGG